MKIYNSVTELIGKTPLLRLNNFEKNNSLNARILCKLERFNPAGSVKDRVALSMIIDAEDKGLIKKGGTIIEPTSGNTGIGIACVAAARGYNAVIVMPESMSIERRKLISAYGAKVVLTDASLGMAGAIAKAEELKEDLTVKTETPPVAEKEVLPPPPVDLFSPDFPCKPWYFCPPIRYD